jgi:hypothetical protein
MRIVCQRHFSPFKTYIRRDLGLVVCVSPKVGSSAIRKVLVEGLQMIGAKPKLGRYWPLTLTRRYLTPRPTELIDTLIHLERYEFHCFVRNPYARLLSAWKDKMAFGHDHAPSMARVVPRIRRFAARHGLPGHAPDTTIPFPTFVAYVESGREGHRNQHWDTQRSILFTDLIDYYRIFRMETDFVTGMTEILTRIGLPEDWAIEKLKKPLNASGRISEPVYDASLAKRVYKVFACDFEQFGYDPDSWQGL